MAYVDPTTSQSGILSLAGASFLAPGEDAKINYSTNPGGTNPLYSVLKNIAGFKIINKPETKL